MYYPKSQIKTNLYTNGGEYVLSTDFSNYSGYYYLISNGKKYTGKTPQDGPNIELTTPGTNTGFNSLITPVTGQPTIILNNPIVGDQATINEFDSSYVNPNITQAQPRSIPLFSLTLPTQNDNNLGVFTRYFCKKNNELRYLEINQDTYDKLNSRSSKIAWDLYSGLSLLWEIKGEKSKVYEINKSNVFLLEQRNSWIGFSQYLKENYLKYYLGS